MPLNRKGLSIVGVLLTVLWVASDPAAGQSPDGQSFRALNYPDHYIRHRNWLGYIDKIVAADRLGRNDGTFRVVRGLAGSCSSFESLNYPGHFLRHQNYRLKLAPRSDDELFQKDATFCFRSGLANASATSFESFNFPGHYIRHSNFELWIARADGSALFNKDATFIVSPSLAKHGPAVPID